MAITAETWQAVKREFLHDQQISFEDLANRHGIKPVTVRQKASREGWHAQKEKVNRTVVDLASAGMIEVRADELSRFNSEDLKVAKALRDQVIRHLKKAQDADIELSANVLRQLAVTAEQAQRIGRLALGASTSNLEAVVREKLDLSEVPTAELELVEDILAKYVPEKSSNKVTSGDFEDST